MPWLILAWPSSCGGIRAGSTKANVIRNLVEAQTITAGHRKHNFTADALQFCNLDGNLRDIPRLVSQKWGISLKHQSAQRTSASYLCCIIWLVGHQDRASDTKNGIGPRTKNLVEQPIRPMECVDMYRVLRRHMLLEDFQGVLISLSRMNHQGQAARDSDVRLASEDPKHLLTRPRVIRVQPLGIVQATLTPTNGFVTASL
mmetsp:Transcript_14406/g.26764  ORF Transcript_14406/g.26764 Transcript_14406/m.26764 type:complete len:201 (+) Transcript_14406:159-761(+)